MPVHLFGHVTPRNVYEKKGIPANRIEQFGKLIESPESGVESEDDESMENQ